MTVPELSAKVSVNATNESRRECGHVTFSMPELYRYAIALDCSPADLLPRKK
jgi:hypothetical protein